MDGGRRKIVLSDPKPSASASEPIEGNNQDGLNSQRDSRLRLPVSSVAGGLAPGFSSFEEALATADLIADLRLARPLR